MNIKQIKVFGIDEETKAEYIMAAGLCRSPFSATEQHKQQTNFRDDQTHGPLESALPRAFRCISRSSLAHSFTYRFLKITHDQNTLSSIKRFESITLMNVLEFTLSRFNVLRKMLLVCICSREVKSGCGCEFTNPKLNIQV